MDITLVGGTYLGMMLFMGLAAINSQANLLFGVFGLMIGVMLVSWGVSRAVLRKIGIRRLLPEYAEVGQPAAIQYELENRKRFFPSLSVTLSELSVEDGFTKQPQAYLLHAAAGTSAMVPTMVVPKRRGLQQFDRVQLMTSFPFGFVRRIFVQGQKDALVVHPPMAQIDSRLLSRCLSAEQSGSRMRPRRGGDDEFYGVKEYRQGENPRAIYWRRSARTGTMVTKEMTHIAPPRLLIAIDTHMPRRTSQRQAGVERAIAMAASLVSRTLEQGLSVGVCAWSGHWLIIPPSRGKRHVRDVLAALAQLPPNPSASRADLVEQAAMSLHEGTTPVLITPDDLPGSLGEQTRGNWIVLPVDGDLARRSFRFADDVDFEQCVPLDQATLP